MKHGKLIVFEGLDGVGKSTQVRKLVHRFREVKRRSEDYRVLEFPCFTSPSAQGIKRLLVEQQIELPTRILHELALSARVLDYQEVIKPTLESGGDVVADRHLWSAGVYQGVSEEDVLRYSDHDIAGRPDLTIYIHLPMDEIKRRLEQRGRIEAIEEGMLSHFEIMQQRYNHLMNLYQNEGFHVAVIDGNQEPDVISDEILRVVKSVFHP